MQARVFKFNDVVLPDPDPNMSPDDVRKLYATQYPALNNAKATYPNAEGGNYEFTEKAPKSGAKEVVFKDGPQRNG